MEKAPKSLRLHIGIFGRTNVGKSSFLNMVTGQDAAITSRHPGTTTDVVEKTMELLPLGPVVFLDTAGLDDKSALGAERVRKGLKAFERVDILLLVVEPDVWTDYEEEVIKAAGENNVPVVLVINKIDISDPSDDFISTVSQRVSKVLPVHSECAERKERDKYINALKAALIDICPEDFVKPPTIAGDLVPKGGTAILIVPIDLEAPKGRIILPQVQLIRDLLDNDAAALVVKESEYVTVLNNLKTPPDLVVCDSQVVDKMVADTPEGVPCTTFSILFGRVKGDLAELAGGAAVIDSLVPGDKILIAEACTHHPIEDDIGRVKLPAWFSDYLGGDLDIDTFSGKDFPDDISRYKLIVHCGACMFNRKQMLYRLQMAKTEDIPITNYGVAISVLLRAAERVLEPFPEALEALNRERDLAQKGA